METRVGRHHVGCVELAILVDPLEAVQSVEVSLARSWFWMGLAGSSVMRSSTVPWMIRVGFLLRGQERRPVQASGTLRSISSSQMRADMSDGARQSPRGDSAPPADTFGPFGSADRLN